MIALLRAIPLWAYILAGALVVIGVQEVRISAQKARTALADLRTTEAKGQLEKFRREAAEAVASSQAEARQLEQRHAADLSRIAKQYEMEKKDAQAAADRLARDLRNGTVKLRDEWQACRAASNMPNLGSDSGIADPAPGLREAGVLRVLSIVRSCQSERDALLNIAESDRSVK